MTGEIMDEPIKVEAEEVSKEVSRTSNKPDSEVAISPMQLIELAISKDADVDKLEKLMQLKERWDKENARKSFIADLAAFQSKCPVIIKSKEGGKTKEGAVAYKYAPIDKVLTTKNEEGRQVKELLKIGRASCRERVKIRGG